MKFFIFVFNGRVNVDVLIFWVCLRTFRCFLQVKLVMSFMWNTSNLLNLRWHCNLLFVMKSSMERLIKIKLSMVFCNCLILLGLIWGGFVPKSIWLGKSSWIIRIWRQNVRMGFVGRQPEAIGKSGLLWDKQNQQQNFEESITKITTCIVLINSKRIG